MTEELLIEVANGVRPVERLNLPIVIVRDKVYSALNAECNVVWKVFTKPSLSTCLTVDKKVALALIDRLGLVKVVSDNRYGSVYDTADGAWRKAHCNDRIPDGL